MAGKQRSGLSEFLKWSQLLFECECVDEHIPHIPVYRMRKLEELAFAVLTDAIEAERREAQAKMDALAADLVQSSIGDVANLFDE